VKECKEEGEMDGKEAVSAKSKEASSAGNGNSCLKIVYDIAQAYKIGVTF
jgi:hypothetical protein